MIKPCFVKPRHLAWRCSFCFYVFTTRVASTLQHAAFPVFISGLSHIPEVTTQDTWTVHSGLCTFFYIKSLNQPTSPPASPHFPPMPYIFLNVFLNVFNILNNCLCICKKCGLFQISVPVQTMKCLA